MATDLSPEMLEVATNRTREAGLDNVQFISASHCDYHGRLTI